MTIIIIIVSFALLTASSIGLLRSYWRGRLRWVFAALVGALMVITAAPIINLANTDAYLSALPYLRSLHVIMLCGVVWALFNLEEYV